MAKGDHDRSERRIDEQMKQSQGYLTGVQQQLGNQSQGLNSLYTGGWPQSGETYGYGSTVPHYSQQGPYFSGNGTDAPSRGIPSGEGNNERFVGSGSSPDAIRNQIMPILQKYGGASSQALERALPEIQRLFPGTTKDDSGGPLDELVIPGLGIVDFIQGAESGSPNSNWTFQTGLGGGGGFGGGSSSGGILGRNLGDYNNITSRFNQFADTGGYSQGDLANIRSRAVSPIRSVYSSARQGLDRQRSLQGGYSPGYATALGRFSREQGQLGSDAATNAEASIAEMVNRGKQFGMSGLLSAYGATPGLSNMIGQQSLTSQGQQLQAAGLQNQLSLGLIGGQNQMSNIPGDVGGFISGVGDFAKNASGALYPWLGGA